MPPEVLETAAALVEPDVQIIELYHGECIITERPDVL